MHETPLAYYHLDEPAAAPPLSTGWHCLRGWVVSKPGGHFTDVRARLGDHIFPGVHGFPRRDLAEFFHAHQPRLLAGFEINVTLSAGRQTVTVEACDITGLWTPVAQHAWDVSPASTSPAPVSPLPPARLLPHEYAQALRTLLIRLGDQPEALAAGLAGDLAAATPLPRDLRYAPRPLHAHADQPAAWDCARFGRLGVAGWMFHATAPIRRILATADLQAVQALDQDREVPPAIAAHFPNYPQARHSGFAGWLDLPAQLPAPVTIRIYAELEDGDWLLGPVLRTTTTDHEFAKQTFGAWSAGRFRRAERALRAAFARRGLPMEPDPARTAAVRTVRDECRSRAARRSPPHVRNTNTRFHSLERPNVRNTNIADCPRPRLLLLSHNLNREGAPLFLLEYARHLAANHRVSLTVASDQDGPLREAFTAIGAEVLLPDTALLWRSRSARGMQRALRQLATRLDPDRFDLVVANTLACFWGVQLAAAARKPSLFYLHESTTPAGFYHGHLPPAVLPVIESSLSLATRVCFESASTRRYYETLSDGANYCVLPGWIDLRSLDAFQAAHTQATLRDKLGLARDRLVVVNIGSVCDRKGQPVFVRAADLLARSHPALAARADFLMVGGNDTPFARSLQNLVTDLRRPNLRIVPATRDIHDYYGAADLFVCSSYEESFPRVVLLAMGFALPIVTTGVHGIAEMARAGEEAEHVPPGDTAALADAMARMLQDPVMASVLARQARGRVAAHYASELVLPRHAALTSTLVPLPARDA